EDLVKRASNLVKVIDKQIRIAQDKIVEYSTSTDPVAGVSALADAAKAIFGDGFLLVPAFSLAPQQADEWENVMSVSAQLTKFQSDELPDEFKIDFPVDHWLYGLARVREKLGHWENAIFLAEAFETVSPAMLPADRKAMPDLQPAQFPFQPNDRWLALQFRKPTESEADFQVNADRLLYTAAYAKPFDKHAPQCGLLLDEWTEVIPKKQETTGIAFHYDRPNAEPPQAILLAMPSVMKGNWDWDDLVATLNETYQMAQMRAVEPGFIDDTEYARFLPATMMTVTTQLLTVSTDLAINNNMYAFMQVQP
ncbi:MAG: hypothetical protein ABIQ93_05555, partial [Saprospiraceae bacterium]